MTTKIEQIIMELLVKDEHSHAAIASLDNLSSKVTMTQASLRSLAAQSGASIKEVAESMRKLDESFGARGLPTIGTDVIGEAETKALATGRELVANKQQQIRLVVEDVKYEQAKTAELQKQLDLQSRAEADALTGPSKKDLAVQADIERQATEANTASTRAEAQAKMENSEALKKNIQQRLRLEPALLKQTEAQAAANVATGLSNKNITTANATVDDYKKAITGLSQELGVGYNKATSLLEKTTLGAEQGTHKLRAALRSLGNDALKSGKDIENGIIKETLPKLRQELTAISKLEPPAKQIDAVARLSLRMQELTGIPAQKWGKQFAESLGMSTDHARAMGKQIDIIRNGIIGTATASINLSSILNTAFGVGMAMLIFGIVQAIQNLIMGFKNAIDASNELRQNLLKLGSAEKIISQMGGDVAPADFEKLIAELNKKFVLSPRIDIVSGLKKLAIEVAPLGYGQKQIEELMMVALLKQIEDPSKSLDAIIEPMTTALFGGALKGLQGLSFNISDTTIKREAERIGIWKETEGAMSSVIRQQAIYSILVEQTLGKEAALLEAQNNLVFSSERLSATWSDLSENFGATVAPVWNKFLDNLERNLRKTSEALDEWKKSLKEIYPHLMVMVDGFFLLTTFGSEGTQEMMKQYQELGFGGMIEKYKKQFEDLSEFPDTPTGEKQIIPDGTDDDVSSKTDRMKKDIQSLIEWLDNLGDKARKMAEDFAKSFERMQSDFNDKVLRFMEDWGIARERLIEDSNKNLEKKNKQHFDREYWEYLKFQERLRQLREKYLFNLEDALRERDARQVLRLGRQYAMDVNDATIAYDLAKAEREARRREDDDAARQDLVDKVKRLNEDRALQLERMKEDHALKEARAQEDHRIAMDRLDDEIEDKLRKVSDAWAEEFGLDRDGAEDIYNELKKFYGQGGLINDLFFYTYDNLIGTAKNTYEEIQSYVTKYLEQARILEEARRRIMGYRPQGKDVGGIDWNLSSQTILPTSSLPVQVVKQVTVQKVEMVVDMLLSPDLEYRIRRSTIQDVNEVLVRFNRSRNRR